MDGWQRNHRVHIYLDKQIKIRYIHIKKTAWNFIGDSKLLFYISIISVFSYIYHFSFPYFSLYHICQPFTRFCQIT